MLKMCVCVRVGLGECVYVYAHAHGDVETHASSLTPTYSYIHTHLTFRGPCAEYTYEENKKNQRKIKKNMKLMIMKIRNGNKR